MLSMADISSSVERLEKALLSVNEIEANSIIDETVKDMTPLDCAENLITPVLRRIGEGWTEGRVSLSQIYMGGRICEKAMDRLLPQAKQIRKNQPRVAVAVLEDYHNLGARLLWSVLTASGIEVIDYGHQTVASLASKAKEDRVELLLVSTLMYRSALRNRDLGKALGQGPTRPLLMVGGAPFIFDSELWRVVGADETGTDSSSVMTVVNRMSEARP